VPTPPRRSRASPGRRWTLPALLSPLATACLACLILTGCGGVDDVARNDPGERRGPTEEGGSRTAVVATSVLLLPLAKKAGEVVAREPGIDVDYRVVGSRVALTQLCSRKAQVALSNTAMTEAQRAVCEENGVDPVRSLVAHHVIALYRHGSLEIGCLTVSQLRRLWSAGSKVDRYSELGPGLPDRPVELIAYPPQSAAYEFFSRALTGDEHALREQVRSVADRLRFEAGVRSTPGALAFGPYTRALVGERPRLVAVDAGKGCVTPGPRTVRSGAYAPLSRPLFMYSTRQALTTGPAKALVDYVLDEPRRVAQYPGIVPARRAQIPEAEPRR
jgi:phosphate transport system substrate-binding protein